MSALLWCMGGREAEDGNPWLWWPVAVVAHGQHSPRGRCEWPCALLKGLLELLACMCEVHIT